MLELDRLSPVCFLFYSYIFIIRSKFPPFFDLKLGPGELALIVKIFFFLRAFVLSESDSISSFILKPEDIVPV